MAFNPTSTPNFNTVNIPAGASYVRCCSHKMVEPTTAPDVDVADVNLERDDQAQAEFGASAEVDLNMDDNPAPSAMNLDGANDAPAESRLPTLETRIPAKKDASLREFLSKMDDYAPIVRACDSLMLHFH